MYVYVCMCVYTIDSVISIHILANSTITVDYTKALQMDATLFHCIKLNPCKNPTIVFLWSCHAITQTASP